MGKRPDINLTDIPWPVSLLRCNQCLGKMRPGDERIIILEDVSLKDNLILLFNAMPELSFQVRESRGVYHMNIKKMQ